jgi:prefoldin subunit 5
VTLFRDQELRDLQRQIEALRATTSMLERTMTAHSALIQQVQAEVNALTAVRTA